MEILNKLSPAQVHLIREGVDATLKDLLKYTLADLLLREILTLEEREDQTHPNSLPRDLTYVFPGENFRNYECQLHEMCFLESFYQSDDIEIMFKHLVVAAYQNARPKGEYVYRQLIKGEALTGYFKTGVFNAVFARVILTEQGVAAKQQIESALQDIEQRLPALRKSSKAAASQMLRSIRGNVLFLADLDLDWLAEIDAELAQIIAQQKQREGPDEFPDLFEFADDWFDAFDTAFDSAASSDSGGDGGSGCSGCSGCGGCGGCS